MDVKEEKVEEVKKEVEDLEKAVAVISKLKNDFNNIIETVKKPEQEELAEKKKIYVHDVDNKLTDYYPTDALTYYLNYGDLDNFKGQTPNFLSNVLDYIKDDMFEFKANEPMSSMRNLKEKIVEREGAEMYFKEKTRCQCMIDIGFQGIEGKENEAFQHVITQCSQPAINDQVCAIHKSIIGGRKPNDNLLFLSWKNKRDDNKYPDVDAINNASFLVHENLMVRFHLEDMMVRKNKNRNKLIMRLVTAMNQMASKFDALFDKSVEYRLDIKELKTEIKELRRNIKDLQKELETSKEENLAMQQQLQSLEARLKEKEAELAEKQKENDTVNRKMAKLRLMNLKRKRELDASLTNNSAKELHWASDKYTQAMDKLKKPSPSDVKCLSEIAQVKYQPYSHQRKIVSAFKNDTYIGGSAQFRTSDCKEEEGTIFLTKPEARKITQNGSGIMFVGTGMGKTLMATSLIHCRKDELLKQDTTERTVLNVLIIAYNDSSNSAWQKQNQEFFDQLNQLQGAKVHPEVKNFTQTQDVGTGTPPHIVIIDEIHNYINFDGELSDIGNVLLNQLEAFRKDNPYMVTIGLTATPFVASALAGGVAMNKNLMNLIRLVGIDLAANYLEEWIGKIEKMKDPPNLYGAEGGLRKLQQYEQCWGLDGSDEDNTGIIKVESPQVWNETSGNGSVDEKKEQVAFRPGRFALEMKPQIFNMNDYGKSISGAEPPKDYNPPQDYNDQLKKYFNVPNQYLEGETVQFNDRGRRINGLFLSGMSHKIAIDVAKNTQREFPERAILDAREGTKQVDTRIEMPPLPQIAGQALGDLADKNLKQGDLIRSFVWANPYDQTYMNFPLTMDVNVNDNGNDNVRLFLDKVFFPSKGLEGMVADFSFTGAAQENVKQTNFPTKKEKAEVHANETNNRRKQERQRKRDELERRDVDRRNRLQQAKQNKFLNASKSVAIYTQGYVDYGPTDTYAYKSSKDMFSAKNMFSQEEIMEEGTEIAMTQIWEFDDQTAQFTKKNIKRSSDLESLKNSFNELAELTVKPGGSGKEPKMHMMFMTSGENPAKSGRVSTEGFDLKEINTMVITDPKARLFTGKESMQIKNKQQAKQFMQNYPRTTAHIKKNLKDGITDFLVPHRFYLTRNELEQIRGRVFRMNSHRFNSTAKVYSTMSRDHASRLNLELPTRKTLDYYVRGKDIASSNVSSADCPAHKPENLYGAMLGLYKASVQDLIDDLNQPFEDQIHTRNLTALWNISFLGKGKLDFENVDVNDLAEFNNNSNCRDDYIGAKNILTKMKDTWTKLENILDTYGNLSEQEPEKQKHIIYKLARTFIAKHTEKKRDFKSFDNELNNQTIEHIIGKPPRTRRSQAQPQIPVLMNVDDKIKNTKDVDMKNFVSNKSKKRKLK